MDQIERLIARAVQVVEDSPGQIITFTIVVDGKGIPICWQVLQKQAEGLPKETQIAPCISVK